nr:hypothetical protein Ade03nite_40140 [Actinoplanes derwentensis]
MTVDRVLSSTAIGIAVAMAGHVAAATPWLCTAYTFSRYAAPDSVFMVTLLTGALELLLFGVCMALGYGLRRNSPNLARGVIAGWLGGLLAIPCGGTVVVGFLATLI